VGGNSLTIQVLKPGLFTTIQDLGRFQFQRYGVSVGGAMDQVSMKIANFIVGNHENEAVIEITMIGPVLQFFCNTLISITGANLTPMINGKKVGGYKPIQVYTDDVLSFKGVVKGCRAYIAFKGGIHVKPILGSKSYFPYINDETTLLHRHLRSGDILHIQPFTFHKPIRWKVNDTTHLREKNVIRYIPGPQFHEFDRNDIRLFEEQFYKVLPESNRIGYRLFGAPLLKKTRGELLSEGTTFGTIQVPGDGQPIILMADRQPTGGYPKLGQVISVDLPMLAQIKPGDIITFKQVTLDEAYSLKEQESNRLKIIKKMIQEQWK